MFTNTKHTKKAYILVLTLITLFSIFMQFRKAFINEHTISKLIINQFYFTTQSNYLVLITSLLLLFDLDFKILKHITYYSIIITGIIFHAFLAIHLDLHLVHHLLHSVTPLLFLIYYMFFNKDRLKINKLYLLFIHPILFLLLNYLVLKVWFLDHLIIVREYEFIYPFLNPIHYNNNYFLMTIVLLIGYILLIVLINLISNFFIKIIHKL